MCNTRPASDGCILCYIESGDGLTDACCCCCRYWCPTCVRKACCPRHSQRVTSQFTDPVVAADSAPADVTQRSPVVLLLKQLPPNCSTIVVACQPSPADVISGSGAGQGEAAACCGDCGRSPSLRSSGAMLMTPPRHGRRRSGSGYSASVRASPLSGYGRRASGPRPAAYFSPFVRPRTGSDATCATCVAAASSLGSSSCSVAVDVGGPQADGRTARRSWFRHIGIGESAWRVRRRDSVAAYDDRCSAACGDTTRIMPSAPSLSRLPPSYSSICVTSWTQQQQPPLSASRGAPSPSLSVQTELKAVEWKSFEDI